jgi:hypothetical protein
MLGAMTLSIKTVSITMLCMEIYTVARFWMANNDRCFRCFEKETIAHLLNGCEDSKMIWRKLGITDSLVPNLIGLTRRRSELEIRSDFIAQLVFCKQELPWDVLTGVTIEKYATGFARNNNCTNCAQNLLTVL